MFPVPAFPLQVVMKNTIEAFKSEDKNAFIHRAGESMWAAIQSGAFWRDPASCLARFSVLLFGDLKKYVFYYWFAFPAFNVPASVKVVSAVKVSEELEDGLIQDIVQEFRNRSQSINLFLCFIFCWIYFFILLNVPSRVSVRNIENQLMKTINTFYYTVQFNSLKRY